MAGGMEQGEFVELVIATTPAATRWWLCHPVSGQGLPALRASAILSCQSAKFDRSIVWHTRRSSRRTK